MIPITVHVFFNFICKKECNIKEIESRKLIFEVLKHSKIVERLDFSDKFWQQFKIRDENVRKQMGLYETENINNPNICIVDILCKMRYSRNEF